MRHLSLCEATLIPFLRQNTFAPHAKRLYYPGINLFIGDVLRWQSFKSPEKSQPDLENTWSAALVEEMFPKLAR